MQQQHEKNKRDGRDREPDPLVFHIASKRQFYRRLGMSQVELSQLTGISRKTLTKYETTGVMPEAVNHLLSIALALDVPIEDLIAPWILDTRRADIEERRLDLKLNQADDNYRDPQHEG